jgi:O-antigen/teichoic acid export membrane protein
MIALSMILATVIGLCSNIVLILLLGVVGAALSKVVMYFVLIISLFLLGRKTMPIKLDKTGSKEEVLFQLLMISILSPIVYWMGNGKLMLLG